MARLRRTVAVGLLLFALAGCGDHSSKISQGEHYPSFQAMDIDGNLVDSDSFDGQVLVVNWLVVGYPDDNTTEARFDGVAAAAYELRMEDVRFLTIAAKYRLHSDEPPMPVDDDLRALRARSNVSWPLVPDHEGELSGLFGFDDCGADYCIMVFDQEGGMYSAMEADRQYILNTVRTLLGPGCDEGPDMPEYCISSP